LENSVIYVKAAEVLWYSYNLKTCSTCFGPNSKSHAQNQSKTPFLESKKLRLKKNPGARGSWFLEEKENLFKPNEIFFEARARIKVWPL
jgi:hypothetical protein